MTEVAVWPLLAIGVVAQLIAVLGVLIAADVFDRLHFTGPASIFGPFCLALAIVIDEGPLSQAGLKSMLVALLLLALSPVLARHRARGVRARAGQPRASV